MNLLAVADERTNRVRLYPESAYFQYPGLPSEPLFQTMMHFELMEAEMAASDWARRNGHTITKRL